MDDLTRLKLLTDENDAPASEGSGTCGSCAAPGAFARMFTDEQLMQLLELHGGDVRAAAYDDMEVENAMPKEENVLYQAQVMTENDPLNLRDCPGGKKIDELPKGCTVDVLDERDGWMRVRYGDLLGWACGDYLSKTCFKEEEVAGVTIRVVIRDEAGNEFRPVGACTVDVEIIPDIVD